MIDILQKYLIIEQWERELTDAIHNHQRVTLHYKGFKGTPDPKTGKMRGKEKDFTVASPPGIRVVLPVALGLDKRTGTMVLRAYQTSGVQTRGRHKDGDVPPNWKYYRVDRISRIIPREGEEDLNNPLPPGYKDNDKLMSVVYAQATDEVGGVDQEVPVQTAPAQPVPSYQDVQAQPIPKRPVAPTKLDTMPDNAKYVLKQPEPKPAPQMKPTPKAEPKKPAPINKQPVAQVLPPAEPEKQEPDEEEGMLGLSEEVYKLQEWINRINKTTI
jgi:hypothetical protein